MLIINKVTRVSAVCFNDHAMRLSAARTHNLKKGRLAQGGKNIYATGRALSIVVMVS